MTNRERLRGVVLTWLVLSVGALASYAGGEDHGKAPIQGSAGGGAPSGAAGGDLAGTYPDPTISESYKGWTDSGTSVDLTTATDAVKLGTGLVQFGGTTSSFPALKRSSAILQARLADDSLFTIFEADRVRFGDGSSASCALGFTSGVNCGFKKSGDGIFGVHNSVEIYRFGQTFFQMAPTCALTWGTSMVAMDVGIGRQAAGVARISGTSSTLGGNLQIPGKGSLNSQVMEIGSVSELLTLSTSGITTDTTADLLPANSVIYAVTCRVTTTITTAVSWSVGTSASAERFSAANATMTAGTTSVGLDHYASATQAQVAAAKVRITTSGTPGAGAIRITSHFATFTAPGS